MKITNDLLNKVAEEGLSELTDKEIDEYLEYVEAWKTTDDCLQFLAEEDFTKIIKDYANSTRQIIYKVGIESDVAALAGFYFTQHVFADPELKQAFCYTFPFSRPKHLPRGSINALSDPESVKTKIKRLESDWKDIAGVFYEHFNFLVEKERGFIGTFITEKDGSRFEYVGFRQDYWDRSVIYCEIKNQYGRVLETHSFANRDYWEEYEVHRGMVLHRLDDSFIFPDPANCVMEYFHKGRLPRDIKPSDFPKFCKRTVHKSPLHWGPKYENLLANVVRMNLHRFPSRTRNTVTQHLVGRDGPKVFPKYQKLIAQPNEASQLVLRHFQNIIQHKLHKCDSIKAMPVWIRKTLLRDVQRAVADATEYRRVQSYNRIKKVRLDEVIGSKDEEGSKPMLRHEAFDSPNDQFYTTIPPADISTILKDDPVRQLIARNLHRKSVEIHKDLRQKGFDIGLRRTQQLKKKIFAIKVQADRERDFIERFFYGEVRDKNRLRKRHTNIYCRGKYDTKEGLVVVYGAQEYGQENLRELLYSLVSTS